MSELLKIVLLAVVQGIAEFLPISSSGHLALLGNMLELEKESSVFIYVILHAGTLMAMIFVYFSELIKLMKPNGSKMVLKIVVGSLPIAVCGILLHISGIAETLFSGTLLLGAGFLVTGAFLFYCSKKKNTETAMEDMSVKDALFIGLAQGLAILPGVSRSGTTIAAGMIRGIKKEDAATFSFLLAMPAIAGASLVEVSSVILKGDVILHGTKFLYLMIGFVISALVGYFALKVLLISVRKGNLAIYAYYCILLGSAVVIYKVLHMFTG